jgi:predicted PurR-regulated permease PerM
MRKILKMLWIIQEKKIINPFNEVSTLKRLNPYNPLSYLTILLCLIIGVFMFGFVGVFNEFNMDELKFKWM